jgi:hypothetical protein
MRNLPGLARDCQYPCDFLKYKVRRRGSRGGGGKVKTKVKTSPQEPAPYLIRGRKGRQRKAGEIQCLAPISAGILGASGLRIFPAPILESRIALSKHLAVKISMFCGILAAIYVPDTERH